MFDSIFPSLVWALVVALTATAAITDARHGIIPNWLTLPCAVGAPLVHLLAGGPRAALESVVGLGVCALVPWILFLRRAIGGGDVKLFAAVGALLGPRVGLSVEIFGFIATAVYAMGLLAWRGRLLATLGRSARLAVSPLVPQARRAPVEPDLMEPVRMGVPVFAGALVWMVMTAVGAVG